MAETWGDWLILGLVAWTALMLTITAIVAWWQR